VPTSLILPIPAAPLGFSPSALETLMALPAAQTLPPMPTAWPAPSTPTPATPCMAVASMPLLPNVAAGGSGLAAVPASGLATLPKKKGKRSREGGGDGPAPKRQDGTFTTTFRQHRHKDLNSNPCTDTATGVEHEGGRCPSYSEHWHNRHTIDSATGLNIDTKKGPYRHDTGCSNKGNAPRKPRKPPAHCSAAPRCLASAPRRKAKLATLPPPWFLKS